MKTIIINGKEFELIKSNKHNVAPITGCNTWDIFVAYDNPSMTKIVIWEDWCKWCDDVNREGAECGLQIDSHNCFSFTISGSYRVNGKVYDLWITKAHNRCYEH